MKAAIYNPYWDTLGGGEKYTASVVELFLEKGYKVDIEWQDKKLIDKIKKRFSIDIQNANIVEDVKRGDGYDLMFWVSDGSIPTLKSRNNILHFQFPFKNINGKTLINKMKLFRIKHVVVNSRFTKKFIDNEFGINSKVIYPPIDTNSFRSSKKENLICYVGRFSQLTQSKNQHILVEIFKKMYDSGFSDWKLILAGGGEVGAKKYIEDLRKITVGYPITIKVSPTFSEIKDIYAKSKIFWSAVGLNIDQYKSPLKVEHFGMTLVEAMSAKCVPVVTRKGGYTEIVNTNNGVFYKTKTGLLNKTIKVINYKKLINLSKVAYEDSKKFDKKYFKENFSKLI